MSEPHCGRYDVRFASDLRNIEINGGACSEAISAWDTEKPLAEVSRRLLAQRSRPGTAPAAGLDAVEAAGVLRAGWRQRSWSAAARRPRSSPRRRGAGGQLYDLVGDLLLAQPAR